MPRDPMLLSKPNAPAPSAPIGSVTRRRPYRFWLTLLLCGSFIFALAARFPSATFIGYLAAATLGCAAFLLWRQGRHLDRELRRHRETEERLVTANQEALLLYRASRALHSTLQLDALTHLVLSMAASPAAGGFQRAMLFLVNERTGTLQGMLGIDQTGSAQIFPPGTGKTDGGGEFPPLTADICAAQRQTPFNQQTIKQRLPLDANHNPLARACLERRFVMVPPDSLAAGGMRQLTEELGITSCACVPLAGGDHPFGVMVVEPGKGQVIGPTRQRFLELFAGQAATALENARLLHRLEGTHRELREVQEQLVQGEKLAVLGEMAAQVAHELKNPLVAVGGFAQRLTRLELPDPRATEYAAIIAREVRRLEEMLGNILAFSKKQMVCLEECDLNELIYETLTLELDQQRGGIELVTDIEAPLPQLVGDCRQLRQVVLNLLANARQALARGGRIHLRAGSCTLRGEDAVFVQVEDTGGGIPSDIMRNIFNPFFSTHPKGTGLGLSISHRIVEQHYGEIEVVNGELGACFTVRLPLKPPYRAIR
jgi:signal transduction histidine kinase